MEMLYYVIYSSIPTRKLSEAELRELLQISRQQNATKGITGMLLVLNQMYIQLIEGNKAEVDLLYTQIRQDRRHKYIQILREGYTDVRFFKEWSMGYDKTELSLDAVKGTHDLGDEKSLRLINIMER